MNEPEFNLGAMKMNSMIASSWSHQDTREGHELPMVEWCRGNADGSWYVDWERTHYLATALLAPPYDMQQMCIQMQAALLIAARGKITEVASLAEADRIAEDCAERYNRSHFQKE